MRTLAIALSKGGVGKTTLAKNIARLFNYDVLLEQPEENPFLARFYQNPKTAALPTQLSNMNLPV